MNAVLLGLIALSATMLAIILAVVALNAAREERRQSDARVAGLSEAIRAADGSPDVASSRPMLAGIQRPAERRRIGLVALLGGLASPAFILGIILLSAESHASRPQATAQQARLPRSIELVALSHEREPGNTDGSAGKLTIRGLISEPSGVPGLERLEVVAAVYDPAGNLVATGHAPVISVISVTSPMAPGASSGAHDSAFTIVIPEVRDVARYRVSFNLGGRTIPHVDRRKGS